MIKISVENIFNSVPVLKELAEKPFKGAMTFKIVRLIRELDKLQEHKRRRKEKDFEM